MERFWSKVDKRGPDECWPWTGKRAPAGYGRLHKPGTTHGYLLAHRVSYWLATGTDPGDLQVRHTCHHPWCVNPAHLLLGTHADNMDDMAAAGRSGQAKLTADQVRAIRAEPPDTTDYALSRRYGVGAYAITCVRTGKTHRHV